MQFKWDEALATGHSEIDRQHRELLVLVNELGSAKADSLNALLRVLDHLMDFAQTHFLMEERLMVEVGYPAPAQEQMIEQHSYFTSEVRLRVLEFRRGALVGVLPLQTFLVEWLAQHEMGSDRSLAEFVRDNSPSAAESQ